MARRFNGSSDYIVFTLPSTLQAVTAGSTTIVVVANMTDTTDGALVHARTSGGTNSWWMESFSAVWNYGQGTTAKNVGSFTTGSWAAYIGRKTTGGANAPRGRKIVFGGSTTDTTAGTGLADGTAPGAGGILQVGRWGTATEYISADVAAVAVFDSDLSDATTATFTTWQAILDALPKWAVHFDQASPTDAITDATGNGGNSSTITGTTIVANPSGFFAAGGAAPTGLAVPLAVGSPTTALALSATPTGLAVPITFGAPTATRQSAAPTGLAIPISFGSPIVTRQSAAPAGLAVPLTLGTPTAALNRTAAPTGLAVPVSLGTPAATAGAFPTGLAIPVTFGAPAVTRQSAAPTGLAIPLGLGAPTATLARSATPAGLAVPLALGAPQAGAQAPYADATLSPGASAPASLAARAAADAVLTTSTITPATLTPGTQ
jgi:hypothetical protein